MTLCKFDHTILWTCMQTVIAKKTHTAHTHLKTPAFSMVLCKLQCFTNLKQDHLGRIHLTIIFAELFGWSRDILPRSLGTPTFLACASRLALTMAASSWPCSRVMLRSLAAVARCGEIGKSHWTHGDFQEWDTPKSWLIMWNPIKVDDDWGYA